MKNSVRPPCYPPADLSWWQIFDWSACWDWLVYHIGIRLYALGLKERRLLLKAIGSVFENRASYSLEGWDYYYDTVQVCADDRNVRVNVRRKMFLTLKVWDGLGVSFQVPRGYIYAERIVVMYSPSEIEKSVVIAAIIQKEVFRLRTIELGILATKPSISYQQVPLQQLMLSAEECQVACDSD